MILETNERLSVVPETLSEFLAILGCADLVVGVSLAATVDGVGLLQHGRRNNFFRSAVL